MPQESDIPPAKQPDSERRKGEADRRRTSGDRRNEARVANDFEPRRNPDASDRRKT